MCKPENSNAEASNSGATTGDALNNADNTTIDYNKIAADAIQSHNAVLEPLESVLGSLEVVYENRNWISGHIVTSAGDIVIPQLFPTTTDKIKLLEQADKYFVAANETEKSLRTITPEAEEKWLRVTPVKALPGQRGIVARAEIVLQR